MTNRSIPSESVGRTTGRPLRSNAFAGVLVGLSAACGARTGLLALGLQEDASPGAPSSASIVGTSTASTAVTTSTISTISMISSEPCGSSASGSLTGCADGTREGFLDPAAYPRIAGCSGGFHVPGVIAANPGSAPACPTVATFDTVTPACCRRGGNDGFDPEGFGCNVADLCATGWHVCEGAADVSLHSPQGCAGATRASDPALFFVTRQSSNGCGDCATGTRTDADCNGSACTTGCAPTPRLSNDLFGCGNLGSTQPLNGCDPLDRMSNMLCSGLSGSNWTCLDDGTGLCEAYAVVHAGPTFGGALCCSD